MVQVGGVRKQLLVLEFGDSGGISQLRLGAVFFYDLSAAKGHLKKRGEGRGVRVT